MVGMGGGTPLSMEALDLVVSVGLESAMIVTYMVIRGVDLEYSSEACEQCTVMCSSMASFLEMRRGATIPTVGDL